MKFEPSVNQKNIFNFMVEGEGNGVIKACAGSGKTTTICEAVKLIPFNKTILFQAFNKSIVQELEKRLPQNVDVKTLHSLGYSAIRKAYPRCKVDNRKTYKIISERAKDWVNGNFNFRKTVEKLVNLAKLNLADSVVELRKIASSQNIPIEFDEIERALEVLEISNQIKNAWDFADMIYIPIKEDLSLPKYDWVFVDECQDLSIVQQKLFFKTLKPTSRFIAVGDPNQSIYFFMGADSKSFNNLINQPNTKEFPLSTTYRCGKQIVNLAKTLVPEIEAKEGAEEGVVDKKASVLSIKEKDLVICRNTAPLVKLCLSFLKERIKAHVKGSDIEEELRKFIRKYKNSSVNSFIQKDLLKELAYTKQNFIRLNPNSKISESSAIQKMEEIIEIFNILVSDSEDIYSAEDINRVLDKIFKQQEGITLSTIHKVKGLEAERVFLLNSNLIPSKYAKTPEQLKQEDNLLYVAYTRAKSYFGVIVDWDYKGKQVKITNPDLENTKIRKVELDTNGNFENFEVYVGQSVKKGSFVKLKNGKEGIITRFASNQDMALMTKDENISFSKDQIDKIEIN